MSANDQLQSLNERIAERIGGELVSLIPEGEWQKLVDVEVAKFKREVAPAIIQDLLKETFKNKAVQDIDELCQTGKWNQLTNEYTFPKLREFIGASGGEIFAAVMSPTMANVLSDLRNRLQNGY